MKKFGTIEIYLLAFTLLFALPQTGYGSHIVGAELTYRMIDPFLFQYEINLTMYRDCENGNIGFDSTIYLFLFRGDDQQSLGFRPIRTSFTTPDTLPISWDNCTDVPYNICIEVGSYIDTVTLPPLPGGYNIGWARCCRNGAVNNIESDQGITVLTHIPSIEPNSSPIFKQLPPAFICLGETLNFDYSATDVDNDSLVYEVSIPWSGRNYNGWGAHSNFSSVIPRNPMGPPPYVPLSFLPGFSSFNPFGSGNLIVDNQSGLLRLTPSQLGLSVFAVSVKEYRDGVLLSENKRDFQIHVVNCRPQGTQPIIFHDLSSVPVVSGDTVFVNFPDSLCYQFQISDSAFNDTVVGFAVGAAFGIGGSLSPPYATLQTDGFNPVIGRVCWQPGCEYVGDTIPLIVGGRDLADCLGYNQVFDTVWVVIGSASKPQVQFQSDTIEVFEGQYFCQSFTASDTFITDSLVPFLQLGDTEASITYQGSNPIQGNLCWKPDCNSAGNIYKFIIGARDKRACRSLHPVALDSIFIKVVSTPPVRTGNDTTICRKSSAILQASGAEAYTWSPIASLTGYNSSNPIAMPDSTQLYWVEGTDSLGCKSRDSVWITVLQLDQGIGNPHDSICKYQPVTLSISGAHRYLWNTGEAGASITQYPLSSTTFWVIPFGENGCPGDTFSFHVYVEESLPRARLNVSPTEGFYPLEAHFYNESTGASIFFWEFGDGYTSSSENPSHTYNNPGNYEVKLRVDNRLGCPDSVTYSSVEVWEETFFPPNAFSPNGDGTNDYFQIPSGAIREIDLSIFNRWGKVVFETSDPNFLWDGTSRGRPVPEGVYVYQVQAQTFNGRVFKASGSITLFR